jgi:hypothetical protein
MADENKNVACKREVARFIWVYAHRECVPSWAVTYRQISIDEVPQSAKCDECGKKMKAPKKEQYLR